MKNLAVDVVDKEVVDIGVEIDGNGVVEILDVVVNRVGVEDVPNYIQLD